MTLRGACRRVRDALWEGHWDHEHLAHCAACRRQADRVAALEGALSRGPDRESAPPGLVAVVQARIALEEEARSRRLLLVAATVSGFITVVAGWSAVPLLARLDPAGWAPVVENFRPEILVGALQGAMTRVGGTAVFLSGAIYALAAAALVGLLAREA